MANESLPKGWIADELANLVQPRGEKVRPSDFPKSKFIGMDHVESQTTQIIGSVPAFTMKSNAARFYEGDVLYGRLRPYLNKITQASFDGLASAEFIVFPDTFILKNSYLKYRLNAADFVNFASHLNEGDRPRVSFEQIGTFQILVPPLAEQQRIVDKVEELFSDLDSGINSLKTARQQLKVYRQAVLKWAFEGKLTAQWRKEQQRQGKLESADTLLAHIKTEREQRYQKELEFWQAEVEDWEVNDKKGKKPRKPKNLKETSLLTQDDLQNFDPIPDSWPWVRLGNVIEEPKYGTSKKCDYDFEGKAVLRIPNIGDSVIDRDDLKFAEFNQEEIQSYQLVKGDLLTIRSNGSVSLVGKCALISERDEDFLYAGYLIRLRPYFAILNSRFLIHCMSSVLLRNQIESKAKSTSGVNNINSGELQNLIIPYCSLAEQERVIEEVESRLSICDQLKADIEANIKKAEVLRQSILKQAFEGQLVPQDPNDEPVSALLERIHQEKQKNIEKVKKISTSPKKQEKMANLREVLESMNSWVNAQELFQQCGIGDNSATDTIENLYLELRDFIKDGEVEVVRRDDEDWLRLVPMEEK